MPKEILQYGRMVEAALRAVVRQSIAEVAAAGLPGNHHFYITFRTTYPGVKIPEYLRARYPAEMTIVLQFQFYDLTVDDSSFGVTLTFNNAPERLIIPLRAITGFADPSVNFALPIPASEMPIEDEFTPELSSKPDVDDEPAAVGDKSGAVVSLDKFRKK